MWEVKSPEIKEAALNFSSSAQGKFQVSQLFSDGIEIINALELTEWNLEDTQALICESCGFTGCKSGDWISLRKSEALVLILPSSRYVWGEGWDKEEYRPPRYLIERGTAYLSISAFENLRAKHHSLPRVEEIRHLNMREATLLFQWEAPSHVLGEPPEVDVRRDIILASSEGDCVEYLKELETIVQSQYKEESDAILRLPLDSERIISFYLDAEEFIEWKALVFDGSSHKLLVDSKYVIAGEDAV